MVSRGKKGINNKNRLLSPFKKVYERFIKIRGEPRKIALGFALGLFVGMSPTMGLQIAIAVFFAALFKWNKISAAIGVWITNPVTAPFIYGMTYVTGARLLGIKKTYILNSEINLDTINKILQKAPGIFWALIIGGLIIGLPLAIAGYYLSYSAITRYQEGVRKKIAKQKERLALRKIKRKKKREKDKTGVKYD